MSRILLSLVCLLLICCLTFHAMIPRAEATGLEAAIPAAGSIIVTPAGVVIGATLVALGLYAAADPEGFENIINAATDAMEAAGTWIKDGTVELLRMVDELGNASYYVDSGLMEDVRSYVAEDVSYIQNHPDLLIASDGFQVVKVGSEYFKGTNLRVYKFVWVEEFSVCSAVYAFCDDTRLKKSTSFDGNYFNYSSNMVRAVSTISSTEDTYQTHLSEKVAAGFVLVDSLVDWSDVESGKYSPLDFPLDVSLGIFPSVPVDGTSARQWSEDYTDRGLKVYGGGSGNNNNDGKWFWKLMLPLTAADLLLMSQADEWSGETAKEFDDYTTVEELEIVSRPEVEFGQGLELAPVTSPSPGTGTDSGTGTDPDTGTDTNPDTGTNTNPDSGTDSGDGSGNDGSSWKPPSDHSQFALADLSKFFPFCIPFDLFDFFKLLNADPVAPSFTWEIQDLSGQTYGLTVDLSQWDSVAQLFRRLQLFLFVCGLAAASRKYIKW